MSTYLHPRTASTIVRAVRANVRALTRIDRWERELRWADYRGPRAAYAERMLARAKRDSARARARMRFPWEVSI